MAVVYSMIGSHTKRLVDAAIDELKRDHYRVIMIMQNEKDDDNGVEVTSSFTTDADELKLMARQILGWMADPTDEKRLEN